MSDIINYAEAVELLNKLAENHGEVGVFWDRGWGDNGEKAEISIIVNGNGQIPKALIDSETYERLKFDGVIKSNSYRGYKARRYHAFKEAP